MSKLKIKTKERRFETARDLYGIFFEDINRAGDGGLYPEMLRNRSFEDSVLPEGYIQQDVHIVQACLPRGGEIAKGKLFRPCCLVQGSQYSRDLNQQLKGRISVWVFLKQGRAFLHAGPELLRTPFQIIQIISRETVKTGWLEEIKPIEEHPQAVSQLHLCVRHFSTAKQRD